MPSARSPSITLPGRAARRRVEAGRRLVEEDELRVADQRERDVEPAPLAARELRRERVRLLVEPDERDRLVDVARFAVVAGVELEALAHGQPRLGARLLQDGADAVAPGGVAVRRVDAEHADLAVGARAEALEDLDRRRLAGAVRPEEGEDLAALDLEVDPATASNWP